MNLSVNENEAQVMDANSVRTINLYARESTNCGGPPMYELRTRVQLFENDHVHCPAPEQPCLMMGYFDFAVRCFAVSVWPWDHRYRCTTGLFQAHTPEGMPDVNNIFRVDIQKGVIINSDE